MTGEITTVERGGATQVLAIDEAMRAVALVETPAEAREHENKAEAVAQYMRREGVGILAQNIAAEYKLRAMRRGGDLLEEMGIRRGKKPPGMAFTLNDLGIEKQRGIALTLARMEMSKGSAGQGRQKIGGRADRPPKNSAPTLAALGIAKDTSAKATFVNWAKYNGQARRYARR